MKAKILILALAILVSGCRSITVERGVDGDFKAVTRGLFTEVSAPSVMIDRKSDEQYRAEFSADGLSGLSPEDIAAGIKLLQIIAGGQ